jgi:hypothetical protein
MHRFGARLAFAAHWKLLVASCWRAVYAGKIWFDVVIKQPPEKKPVG